MKRSKSTVIAKLLLIMALVILPCTVLAPVQAMAATKNVTFTSVTVKKTKLYKTKTRKKVLLTIPKGASVTVVNPTVNGYPNVYKVKYKKTTGFVDIKNLLDSESPVQLKGSMGDYDSSATSSPLYFMKAKRTAPVVSSPSAYGVEQGTILKDAVLGVYGTTNGYSEISYNGERLCVKSDALKSAKPMGNYMYVSSLNGGRLRTAPYIPPNNERMNCFEVVPYQHRVTLLSSSQNGGYTWYKVLVHFKNKYYIEGYMRSDVLSKSAGTQLEINGSHRVVNTGTTQNSSIKDQPNGKQIHSLRNNTTVFATGEIIRAGGRNWAKITSPVNGWIAASHIGFAR